MASDDSKELEKNEVASEIDSDSEAMVDETSEVSAETESTTEASETSEESSETKTPASEAQPEPTPLSPSERFRIYNNNIKDGLHNGIAFTQYLDQLTETADTDELLDAASHLFGFTMNTDFVTFPHQYTAADYYLLFMGRLLELHEQAGLELTSAADHEELSLTFTALGQQPAFKFILVGGSNGGAFFTDKSSGLHLFYLNLERKQLRFNSKAFTDLFAVTLSDLEVSDRMAAIDSLITFAKDLERDYGFSADYTLLETQNDTHYETRHAVLPAGTVDKLFVASADSNYMLRNATEGNGAAIDLDDDLVFSIVDSGTAGAPKWAIMVHDPEGQVSLMRVLLEYDFIRQWYLANRDDLEIQSDPLIFA